jgi:hypothetical protein
VRCAFHGVRLRLDPPSAQLLAPWLDASALSATSPSLGVAVAPAGTRAAPPVLDVLVDGPNVWLGRTTSGFILGDRKGSWLTVEGNPPLVCGALEPPSSPPAAHGPQRELLQSALVVALRQMGVFNLHAAAVCHDGRALVVVGDSGAGKSTTTTALTSAGCDYLGDDGVWIRERAADVELLAHSPSFRLTDHALSSFASLKQHVSRLHTDEKWQVDTTSAFPGRYLSDWLGPTTLLFVEQTARTSSALRVLPLAEAVGLLVAQSSALSLDCHPNPRQHLDLLARLASRSHLARLELGTEWLEQPLSAARKLMARAREFTSPQLGARRGEAT